MFGIGREQNPIPDRYPYQPAFSKFSRTNNSLPLSPPVAASRTRAPGHASLIPTSVLQPLLHAELQIPFKLLARFLSVYKVAEPSTHTSFSRIQTTTCFAEIGDRTELAVYRSRGVPARVECVASCLRVFLVLESRVYVADQICDTLLAIPAQQLSGRG